MENGGKVEKGNWGIRDCVIPITLFGDKVCNWNIIFSLLGIYCAMTMMPLFEIQFQDPSSSS